MYARCIFTLDLFLESSPCVTRSHTSVPHNSSASSPFSISRFPALSFTEVISIRRFITRNTRLTFNVGTDSYCACITLRSAGMCASKRLLVSALEHETILSAHQKIRPVKLRQVISTIVLGDRYKEMRAKSMTVLTQLRNTIAA